MMAIADIQDAFLADIIEHPDDDTPRLIYADWLEDHDQPERAEFIRVQCELAHGIVPDCTYGCPREDCYRCSLHRREYDLLGWICGQGPNIERGLVPHGAWISSAANGGRISPGVNAELVFCRGFAEEVRAPLGALRKHLPALVPRHPIRRAVATDRRPARDGSRESARWGWWNREYFSLDHASDLPGAVFRIMTERPRGGWSWYATESAALDALSAALLAEAWQKSP